MSVGYAFKKPTTTVVKKHRLYPAPAVREWHRVGTNDLVATKPLNLRINSGILGNLLAQKTTGKVQERKNPGTTENSGELRTSH